MCKCHKQAERRWHLSDEALLLIYSLPAQLELTIGNYQKQKASKTLLNLSKVNSEGVDIY